MSLPRGQTRSLNITSGTGLFSHLEILNESFIERFAISAWEPQGPQSNCASRLLSVYAHAWAHTHDSTWYDLVPLPLPEAQSSRILELGEAGGNNSLGSRSVWRHWVSGFMKMLDYIRQSFFPMHASILGTLWGTLKSFQVSCPTDPPPSHQQALAKDSSLADRTGTRPGKFLDFKLTAEGEIR